MELVLLGSVLEEWRGVGRGLNDVESEIGGEGAKNGFTFVVGKEFIAIGEAVRVKLWLGLTTDPETLSFFLIYIISSVCACVHARDLTGGGRR